MVDKELGIIDLDNIRQLSYDLSDLIQQHITANPKLRLEEIATAFLWNICWVGEDFEICRFKRSESFCHNPKVNNSCPNRREFTRADLNGKTHVKKEFYGEHIWIRIVEVIEKAVRGTIDNQPVFWSTPEYGAEVFVKYEEIEDVE